MLRRGQLLLIVFVLLFLATCFLAYSNGANDNFKGVASLFGSHTCNYRTAISWATATTFAGSITSIWLAQWRQKWASRCNHWSADGVFTGRTIEEIRATPRRPLSH